VTTQASKKANTAYRYLQVSLEDHLAHVKLNRPPVNALNRDLIEELTAAAIHLGERDDVWVVTLSSCERAFCAGADLKERAGIPDSLVRAVIKSIQRMVAAWIRIRQPVLAGIQGAALGGGLELALAADIIVASEEAVLGLPEVSLGIIPAGGGTQRLAQRTSLGTAGKWILTGGRFTAQEALADGVVDYVFPASSFIEDFRRITSRVSLAAPLALRQAKKALGGLHAAALLRGFREETEYYTPLIKTADRKEALQAFAEKRTPVWRGK
jgi:enoyl-CoA hydratase/carnithine racemase